MKHVDEATDAFIAEAARQAVMAAAERLYVDPMRLAEGLGHGKLAELLLELKGTTHWAYPSDRERIDRLLDGIEHELRRPH